MNIKKVGLFLGFILLPVVVGITASIATQSSVDSWYLTLEKPFFNPPNWLFAPVWTTLYILMGVSAYLIHTQSPSAMRTLAMDVFYFQLFLNFLWSWLFFWFQSPLLGLICILFLLVVLFVMIRRFYGLNKIAGLLQIPYLLWILFATSLNSAILYLN